MANIEDFEKVDMRIGRIVKVEDFPQAKKPSYRLSIDFGNELGVKKSCAQLVKNYSKNELDGRLVLCVVNFPPRQIGPAVSEVLTLGTPDEKGDCILIEPGKKAVIGGKLY